MRRNLDVVFAVFVGLSCCTPAWAAGNARSFVSNSGVDTNPCTFVAPCRSFAAAVPQTMPGGEVIALDSAGYGTVTIAQAVTILAPLGVHAGISVSGGDGVTVNAASGDVVALRNLSISVVGGVNGITLTSAGALHIAHCDVSGAGRHDINLAPSVAATVTITDTIAQHASLDGIFADSAATLTVSIERCRTDFNHANGIEADRAFVAVQDSAADGNGIGYWSRGNGTTGAVMAVESCVLANNSVGIEVGPLCRATVHNTTAFGGSAPPGSIGFFALQGKLSLDGCTASSATLGVAVNAGDVSVARCTIADNSTDGVDAVSGGIARLTGNTITRNGTGILNNASTVRSSGDNTVDGNTTDVTGGITAANKA